VLVTLVALTESVTTAIVVLAFFVVYQQLENHLLQPLVYGRTVQLSPLAILIAVLVGAEVAGVIGALGSHPDRRHDPDPHRRPAARAARAQGREAALRRRRGGQPHGWSTILIAPSRLAWNIS
jgi:hypothetical protein